MASPWSGKRGPALSGPVVGASGLLLAGMFAVSGVRKAVARRETADMLVEFGMPRRLGPAASVLLPAAELATAGGLLFTGSAPWGAAAACGLLAVFTVAIAVNLAAGRRPTCRCFGRQAAAVGWRTLLRNGSLLVVAGLVAWSGWREPAPTLTAWLGRLSAGQAAALLGAAAAVGVVVLQTRAILDLVAQHGRLLVRLEAVEGALLGQPLGGSAPEFVASDGAGQPVTLAALRARGRPILLVFVEPDCRACDGVVTDTARWRRDYGNLLTVALVDLKGDGADAGDGSCRSGVRRWPVPTACEGRPAPSPSPPMGGSSRRGRRVPRRFLPLSPRSSEPGGAAPSRPATCGPWRTDRETEPRDER